MGTSDCEVALDDTPTMLESTPTTAYGACSLSVAFWNLYKFTGKERDAESGLDNFIKRYHASSLGRFMTPDPIGVMKQKLVDPPQWNMYSYSRNNPLRFIDPMGMYVCQGDKTQCGIVHIALDLAKTAANKLPEGSEERKALEKSIATYGKEGVANGVVVKFGDLTGC